MAKRKLNLVGPAHIVVHKNPGINTRYHEIAKEFVNNGFNRSAAYATVAKTNSNAARQGAKKLFEKPFFIELVNAYLQGEEEAPKQKDWAIKTWTDMVNSNVLDYIDDDGDFLSVPELRKLPLYVQRSIKKIEIETSEEEVSINGKIIMDDGKPLMTKIQRVKIELVDKQKALNDLAKAEKWIETHMNINIKAPVSADQLIKAQMDRQRKLSVNRAIEGESERVND